MAAFVVADKGGRKTASNVVEVGEKGVVSGMASYLLFMKKLE